MKRVTINALQVGLVFKEDVYQRMLTEGTHWIKWSEHVKRYDITRPFIAPCEWNVLLQDVVLKEALHIVEVRDAELGLLYINGLLKEVLPAGRYAYWRGPVEYGFVYVDISKSDITEAVPRHVLAGSLLAPYVRTIVVESHEKALLFADEQYVKLLHSGVYYWWKNSTVLYARKADVRQQQLEINGQEMLTRDKAALRMNAYGTYKVVDVVKTLVENKDYEKQLYVSFQLALRELTGGLTLDELLERKEAIAPQVKEMVSVVAAKLGVEVAGFGIRDIILPGDVKEIMNQVLVAEKKAQANSIMRREETASTRSLLNTAKLMEENQMLFKLKEMEYVEKIAEKVSSISVNGNGALIDHLRQIFVTQK